MVLLGGLGNGLLGCAGRVVVEQLNEEAASAKEVVEGEEGFVADVLDEEFDGLQGVADDGVEVLLAAF